MPTSATLGGLLAKPVPADRRALTLGFTLEVFGEVIPGNATLPHLAIRGKSGATLGWDAVRVQQNPETFPERETKIPIGKDFRRAAPVPVTSIQKKECRGGH
jgi:hypothetical protein